MSNVNRLGELLVREKLISLQQLRQAQDEQRRTGQNLGATLAKHVPTMVPLRTMTAQGVHVAYGADVPAFPSHSPMDSIRSAMERKTSSGRRLDMSEAISFLEAFRHHTLGGAYAASDEKEIGSLEPGKQADFVIWNNDLRQARTAQAVAALKPEATYLAGKAVYEAKAES